MQPESVENTGVASAEPVRATKPVAVIDVGTTSVRMAIAEIADNAQVRTLESLSQAVNLGKDTFTVGSITKATIEDCVRVLKSYRQLLREYQIDRPDQIRVVATSAVREALNRLAFLDRIYSATGLEVEAIDEAEVTRVTYLGLRPFLKSEPSLADAVSIITEVGGGSTELLVVQGGDVAYSHTYRLGSLRMRETLEAGRVPKAKVRNMMETQISRVIEQMRDGIPENGLLEIVALGGDVRFAAAQLIREWSPKELGRLTLPRLEQFTEKVFGMSDDELVQHYHLSFPDAETLAPALLIYARLARAIGLDHILVSRFTMRDGILMDMASGGVWSEEFAEQTIRSAIDLGRKFNFDEGHGHHVAELSRMLFDDLQDEHQLGPRYRLLLYVAALLHEIGLYIGVTGHHKHSMYLISNSELFGLGHTDLLLVALVARYHRRASPKPIHLGYSTLSREHRVAVAKMAALLRVADSMDRSHRQRVRRIKSQVKGSELEISVPELDDLSLEQLALEQKALLFEEIFGMRIRLRTVRR